MKSKIFSSPALNPTNLTTESLQPPPSPAPDPRVLNSVDMIYSDPSKWHVWEPAKLRPNLMILSLHYLDIKKIIKLFLRKDKEINFLSFAIFCSDEFFPIKTFLIVTFFRDSSLPLCMCMCMHVWGLCVPAGVSVVGVWMHVCEFVCL